MKLWFEKMDFIRKLAELIRKEETGPIVRRFFINTLFDSTFVLLGIVVGSFLASETSLETIVLTMFTSSFALGISAGISIYEAESLEEERRIAELEKALFRDLSGTVIEKKARYVTMFTALVNFLTPLFSCMITMLPFIFVALKILEIRLASCISIILALSILFSAGVMLGKLGKRNPWIKGIRMVAFGIIAFIVGFLLDLII